MPRRKVANGPTRSTQRSTRQAAKRNEDGIPQIYEDMLMEAVASEDLESINKNRSAKRRKRSEDSVEITDDLFDSTPLAASATSVLQSKTSPEPHAGPQQIVLNDYEASEDSDVEFEDVDLDIVPSDDIAAEDVENSDPSQSKPLQLDLGTKPAESSRRVIQRRKPITKADRDLRLDVHKWHLLSLLLYQKTVNRWCNDDTLHAILKALVPRKLIRLLHADESQPQFQRNHSFNKGIEELCAIWRREWTITARGLRRAYWRDSVNAQDEFDQAADPVNYEDFVTAAKMREGSRDLGAQLFTALLRALACDARLIFSLQTLPFTGQQAPPTTPQKGKPAYINAAPQSYASGPNNQKQRKIVESPYPTFWTEVLNPATGIWVPLDPIVRNTIAKPRTGFEPPANDSLNTMSYVIAFEDDGYAKDVTRRYSQWYNAKLCKTRVEATKGGLDWWSSVMKQFSRPFGIALPRDEVEDVELLRKTAQEGLPKNVQDFKGHPVYVLERHLRSNEVIHPRREVGKVSTGTAKNSKVESVFRRQDVNLCRTSDAWYRRGRDVAIGEQPLKRAIPRARQRPRSVTPVIDDDDDYNEEQDGIALYAEYQTQVYEPPPTVNGHIPKNAYGNLDIYVPSMIPAGAVHIAHPMAGRAAKVLGIEFVDAVTGFEFKGRQGTAIINGIIIAAGHTAATVAAIETLELMGSEEIQAERSRILLSLWKRMLTALRVRERVDLEYGGNEFLGDDASNDISSQYKSDNDDDDQDDQEYKEEDLGGGFLPDAEETEEKREEQNLNLANLKNKLETKLPDEVVHVPVKVTISTQKLKGPVSQEDGWGRDDLFGSDDEDTRGSPDYQRLAGSSDEVQLANRLSPQNRGIVVGVQEAGGFLIENDDAQEQGGGFNVEDSLNSPGSNPSDGSENNSSEIPLTNKSKLTPITSQNDIFEAAKPQSITSNDSLCAVNTELNTTSQLESNEVHQDSDAASQNSLLSHDPDEDDDEPEWLEDAMDE